MSRSYRIGRGRPPKEHRFAKGRSGNPNGRPRKPVSSPKTSAKARKSLLAIARQPITIKMGGNEVSTTLAEGIDMMFAQGGLKGGPRAVLQVRREFAQAAAEEEQDLSDQYQFWRQWKRDHENAKLYCAAHPDRKLPWPHPVDIRIDAISRKVTFLGAMDADELPLYLAVPEVAELYLVEAELAARASGSADALVRHLRQQAYSAQQSAAPSLGGPGRDDVDMLSHRITARVLDLRAVGVTELRSMRAALFSKFCAALTTLDMPVPGRPPMHTASSARPKSDGSSKRHRLCSVASNADLRHKVHDLLSNGHGVTSIARLLGSKGASRSVLARYVRLYKRINSSWRSDASLQPKDLPTSLRTFQKTFAQFQSYLSDRDIDEKERLRRGELPLKPEKDRKGGASPETINFIKGNILGLDVDPPAETLA